MYREASAASLEFDMSLAVRFSAVYAAKPAAIIFARCSAFSFRPSSRLIFSVCKMTSRSSSI